MIFRILTVCVLVCFSGCAAYNGSIVVQDNVELNRAMALTSERTLLYNLLRLRDRTYPVLVRVNKFTTNLAVSASLEASASLKANNDSESSKIGETVSRNPTIDLQPLDGRKFMTGFHSPIDPKVLAWYLNQGWPTELVLLLSINSLDLDGVRYLNRPSYPKPKKPKRPQKRAEREPALMLAALKQHLCNDPNCDLSGVQMYRTRDFFEQPTLHRVNYEENAKQVAALVAGGAVVCQEGASAVSVFEYEERWALSLNPAVHADPCDGDNQQLKGALTLTIGHSTESHHAIDSRSPRGIMFFLADSIDYPVLANK